jgi:ubiquinone biosynthesis protein UbiJ
MPATPVWLAALESLLNRGIDQSIRASALSGRLNRTSMELCMEGFAPIRIAVSSGRLALTTGGGARADAVITGSLLALLGPGARPGFARREDSAAPQRAERVQICGDAEIAARYRDLLELARPDWEEELSRLIGDLPARRLSLAARAALSWARGFARTTGANVAEYLQEESRALVSKPEVEEFLAKVDELRETADRVEARLARLERRLDRHSDGRAEGRIEGPA